MHHVQLTSLASNHSRLRGDEVEGYCIELPEVGQPFIMFSKSLVSDLNVRLIQTSTVTEVKEDGTFKTKNSTYLLELL